MSFEQEPAAGGDLAYGTNRKSIACRSDANLQPECSANDFIYCGEANERAVHYVTRDVMCTNDCKAI